MAYISIKAFRQNPARFSDAQVSDLCRNQKLTKEFIKQCAPYLNWTEVCLYQPAMLDESFIDEVAEWVNWEALCTWSRHAKFTEEFLDRHKDKICWNIFCRYCTSLSKEFIFSHMDYVNLNSLLRNEYIDKSIKNIDTINTFLRYNPTSYDWTWADFDDITIDFIREHEDKITDWRRIVSKFKHNMAFHNEFCKHYTYKEWSFLIDCFYCFNLDFIMRHEDCWDYQKITIPYWPTDYMDKDDIDQLVKFWYTMKKKPK